MSEWTLRDVRSAISRGAHVPKNVLECLLAHQKEGQSIEAAVDRLIQICGADRYVHTIWHRYDKQAAKERKKNTDEVAERSAAPTAESDRHGGDGNSGEVDAEAETASAKSRKGEWRALRRVARSKSELRADQCRASDARYALQRLRWEQRDALCASRQYGGNFLGDAKEPNDLPDNAQEIAAAIMRLVKQWCGGSGAPSHRLDGERLVREMATQQWRVNRAKRRELSNPVVLLLPDVSGSCSATCREFWQACSVLQKVEPRLVVIPHSNGYIDDAGIAAAGAAGVVIPAGENRYQQWQAILSALNVAGAVALGDEDATEVYKMIAESTQAFVWLDSHGKNTKGLRRAPERMLGWQVQPTAHYLGVGDYKSLAIALRGAMQRGKQ